jgi:hypothetical protein
LERYDDHLARIVPQIPANKVSINASAIVQKMFTLEQAAAVKLQHGNQHPRLLGVFAGEPDCCARDANGNFAPAPEVTRWVMSCNTCGEQITSALPPKGDLGKAG